MSASNLQAALGSGICELLRPSWELWWAYMGSISGGAAVAKYIPSLLVGGLLASSVVSAGMMAIIILWLG